MTVGGVLYLALVVGAFVTFAATLSITAWRTEHHLRRQVRSTHDGGEHDNPSVRHAA